MAYYELIVRVSDIFKDTLIQRLSKAGSLGMIENDKGLVAYFPAVLDIDTIKNDLSLLKTLLEKAGHAHELSCEYSLIAEKDWNASWKQGFQPVDAGKRFTILPPWENKRRDRINLIIDPGMAFGTGHHETTRSCLALLEKFAGTAGEKRFLDLGTGTGILAIAAAMLGFQKVLGIDTDQLAVEAARKNVSINQVPEVKIKLGSLSGLRETFDVITANLISGLLVRFAPALFKRLNPAGMAVLSGILFGQEDEVIEAMEKSGLTLRKKHRDGKWMSLVMERSGKPGAHVPLQKSR